MSLSAVVQPDLSRDSLVALIRCMDALRSLVLRSPESLNDVLLWVGVRGCVLFVVR